MLWCCFRDRRKDVGEHDDGPKITSNPSSEELEQACALRRTVCHFPGAIRSGLYPQLGRNGRVRLKAENERLLQQLALREEEIRIKDARSLDALQIIRVLNSRSTDPNS